MDLRSPSAQERVESRVVPRDGYVAVETNRYPVPLEWAGQRVEVRIQREEIWIGWTEAEPVQHARLSGKHKVARWNGPPGGCRRGGARRRRLVRRAWIRPSWADSGRWRYGRSPVSGSLRVSDSPAMSSSPTSMTRESVLGGEAVADEA